MLLQRNPRMMVLVLGAGGEESEHGSGAVQGRTTDDEALLFGDAKGAAAKFHALVRKDNMEDILASTVEASRELHLRKREEGSTSKLQKAKSLDARWFVKDEGGATTTLVLS